MFVFIGYMIGLTLFVGVVIANYSENKVFSLFLACMYQSTKYRCCHFDVGIGMGITLQSFTSKFFYVMDMGLLDELSSMRTFFFFVLFHHTNINAGFQLVRSDGDFK